MSALDAHADSNAAMNTLALQQRVKGAAIWMYAIAFLTFVNFFMWESGSTLEWVLGLVSPRLLMAAFAEVSREGEALVIPVTMMPLSVFVVLGYFTSQGRMWALITATALFALDSIGFLATPTDVFVMLFHAWPLLASSVQSLSAPEARKAAHHGASASGQPVTFRPAGERLRTRQVGPSGGCPGSRAGGPRPRASPINRTSCAPLPG
jgi:hypothetical protein